MVGATKSSSSPSAADIPSATPPSKVRGRGYLVVHGASHAKPRVVRLDGREQRHFESPHAQITGEHAPRLEVGGDHYLSSKFQSTSDRHRGSLLLVGFEGKRGVREELF